MGKVRKSFFHFLENLTHFSFLGPIQSSLIDSTDGDLVVPAIEDLDSMSLEQITELREKIRKKVEKAQEEEMVSQAKQQEQDDDYEYMWEEADPEEEEAKKVDEIIQGLG